MLLLTTISAIFLGFQATIDKDQPYWTRSLLITFDEAPRTRSKRDIPWPTPTPEFLKAYDKELSALRGTGKLIEMGRYAEARSYSDAFLRFHPESTESFRNLLAVLDLLEEDFQKAHRDIAAILNNPQNSRGQEEYLKLSIAVAGEGRVYPGQLQYSMDIIRNYLDLYDRSERLLPPVFGQDSAQDVLFASTLALGLTGGDGRNGFLEMALDIHPANELAAREVFAGYAAQGRFSKVRKRVKTALSHLGATDPSREWFEDWLRRLANKADTVEGDSEAQ